MRHSTFDISSDVCVAVISLFFELNSRSKSHVWQNFILRPSYGKQFCCDY